MTVHADFFTFFPFNFTSLSLSTCTVSLIFSDTLDIIFTEKTIIPLVCTAGSVTSNVNTCNFEVVLMKPWHLVLVENFLTDWSILTAHQSNNCVPWHPMPDWSLCVQTHILAFSINRPKGSVYWLPEDFVRNKLWD